MSIRIRSGAVEVLLPSRDPSKDAGWIHTTATMLGYPSVVKGKPTLVEVVTRDGRSTTVMFCNVSPLDDAARTLLAGRPVEKNA